MADIFKFPGGSKQIAPARLVAQADKLHTVLNDIDIAEQAASKASSTVIALYMAAGDLLIAVKEEVGHGRFAAWVKANTNRAPRTARLTFVWLRAEPSSRPKSATVLPI